MIWHFPGKLAFICSLPWDQSTMTGYFGEIFYVIAIIQAYMFMNGSILLLFVSICLVHQAFSKMFLNTLNQLNDIELQLCVESYFVSSFNFGVAPKRKFSYCIELTIKFGRVFLSNIFRWFFDSPDVYSLMILVHSICSILFLTCIIFQFDLVSKIGRNSNVSILTTPYLLFSMRLWSVFWIFMHVAILAKWPFKAMWKWVTV